MRKKGKYIVQRKGDPAIPGEKPELWYDTSLDASGGHEFGGKAAGRQAVAKLGADGEGCYRTINIIDEFTASPQTQMVLIGVDKPARKPRKAKEENTKTPGDEDAYA
jgi:hypothetical protein